MASVYGLGVDPKRNLILAANHIEGRGREGTVQVRARSGYNGASPASDPEYGAAGAAVSGPATVRMVSGRS